MSDIKNTPATDDTFIMGYKVGAGLHGTVEDANNAIRRGEGDSWIPLYRKHHCADELLDALKTVMQWIDGWSPSFEYDPSWPEDRDKARAAIAKATGAQ